MNETLACPACNARVLVREFVPRWCPYCAADLPDEPARTVPRGAAATVDPVVHGPPGPKRTCPCCRCVYTGRRDDLRVSPCPTCGQTPPGPEFTERALVHAGAAGATLLLLLVVGLAGAGGGPLEPESAATLAAVLTGVIGLLHVGLLFNPPGGRPEGGLRRNAPLGPLTVVRPGDLNETRDPTALPTVSVLGVVILMAAPVACLAVILYRSCVGGLPAASPGVTPALVTPGDEIRVEVPANVKTVAGIWRATARAELVNGAEVGKPGLALTATTNDVPDWDNSLRVSAGSGEQHVASFWAKVRVPPAPELAGKTLKIRVDLDVKYPAPAYMPGVLRTYFVNKKLTPSHVVTVQLVPAAVVRDYRMAFGGGLLVAGILHALGGLGLAAVIASHRAKD
jgi:hypothetical protein